MIKLGELVMILELHRQGLKVSAIARHLGLDRKTVRRYIERGLEPPSYGVAPKRNVVRAVTIESDRTSRVTSSRESDSMLRVSKSADPLPSDVEALQALVVAARAGDCVARNVAIAERDVAIAEREQALSQNDRLRHLLHQLQRAQFGQRSEKLDPDQLALASRISSKPLWPAKPTTTRRTRLWRAPAPRSAVPIVARFPAICRGCMCDGRAR